MSSRSICSGLSSIPSAPTFSSTRDTRFVPGNRSDVVALGQEPGQSDLTRRRAELGGDGLDLVDEALVALEVLAHEAWIGLAEVAVVQLVQ